MNNKLSLLFFSIATLTILLQPLLADQIKIKNNSATPVFITLIKSNTKNNPTRADLAPGQEKPLTKLELDDYIQNGNLTYHIGLITDKIQNEIPDAQEPSQKSLEAFINTTLAKSEGSLGEATFYTLNKNDETLIIRNFDINYKYDQKNKQLDITIDGNISGKY